MDEDRNTATPDMPDQSGRRRQDDGPPADDEIKRRRAFARSLARSLFGRDYWDDRKDAEIREATKRKPAPHKGTGASTRKT